MQHLPEVPLVTVDGARTTTAVFRGEATVLIFLRHLG